MLENAAAHTATTRSNGRWSAPDRRLAVGSRHSASTENDCQNSEFVAAKETRCTARMDQKVARYGTSFGGFLVSYCGESKRIWEFWDAQAPIAAIGHYHGGEISE